MRAIKARTHPPISRTGAERARYNKCLCVRFSLDTRIVKVCNVGMGNTKTFLVEKKGKRQWIVIRQMPHDPVYVVGSKIPSYGTVIEVRS